VTVDLTIFNHWIQSVGFFKMILAEIIAVKDMLNIMTEKKDNGY